MTDKTKILGIRLEKEKIAVLEKVSGGDIRPFMELFIDALACGALTFEDGEFHGPPTPAEDELDLSDLIIIQKRLGAKKPQQALDYLTRRAIESL